MSTIRLPAARAMNGGVPPTLRKDRTGLLTPPGIYCLASANAAADRLKSNAIFVASYSQRAASSA